MKIFQTECVNMTCIDQHSEDDLYAWLLLTLPKDFDYIYVTWHDTPTEMKTWDVLQRNA